MSKVDLLKTYDMGFNCTMCGMCCKKIGQAVEASKILVSRGSEDEQIIGIANFPFKCDETGKCEMLGDGNICKVYDNRPLICNVEKLYEKYYKNEMSKQNFFDINEQICKQWN